MRSGHKQLAIAMLATTMLATAGCDSSSKPLTRAELTAKANAICKTVTAKLASRSVSTRQDLARVALELASFEQSALTDLSKLVPPASLESDWKQFVAGAQKLAENTAKLSEYEKTNNLKPVQALVASSEAVQKQMVALAKRDGLKECEQVA